MSLKNQKTAGEINTHMLDLTRDNLDESATVRTVTFVTLVYLPASFIAVSFTPGRCFLLYDTNPTSLIVLTRHEPLQLQERHVDHGHSQKFLGLCGFSSTTYNRDDWLLVHHVIRAKEKESSAKSSGRHERRNFRSGIDI